MENDFLQFGLLKTPKDSRDFKHSKTFGSVFVPNVDFDVAEPIRIKSQGNTDMCGAFSSTSVSEDQEGVELDPCYQFALIKEVMGNIQGYGADLRSICKSFTKFGSIEQKDAPFLLTEKGRDYVADINNYPKELTALAEIHKKQSYFRVDEGDIFESIRQALWMHKDKRCSIETGVMWDENWTYADKGIIPTERTGQGYGHAIKIFGQKIINGVPYLKVQNSWNNDVGDGGIYYFPKEVINRDFTFGAFVFIDLDASQVKKQWSLGAKIIDFFKKLCR